MGAESSRASSREKQRPLAAQRFDEHTWKFVCVPCARHEPTSDHSLPYNPFVAPPSDDLHATLDGQVGLEAFCEGLIVNDLH